VFEISFGIEKMSKGRRRRALETAFDEVIVKALGHRIVGFDTAAANAAARARASQIRQGINAEIPDSQIAGIALSLGAAVATRNTADFAGLGLQIVNPWASGT
jgi:predicted nucleic acid-binding protein